MEIVKLREVFHSLFNKINNIFTAVGANKMFADENLDKFSPDELKLRITDLNEALRMIEKNILILNDGLKSVYEELKKEKGV